MSLGHEEQTNHRPPISEDERDRRERWFKSVLGDRRMSSSAAQVMERVVNLPKNYWRLVFGEDEPAT
jgi:hypothetical protein